MPAQRTSRLYNASGQMRQLRASPLLAIGPAAPGPALRRGALVAVPIALALIFEFSFDWPSRAAVAPFVGAAAAIGVLASQWAPAAVIALGLMAAASGYCFADTLRLAFAGFACSVALMLAEGLFLPVHDTLPALLYGTAGGLTQAAWAACVWLVYDRDSDNESGWDWGRTKSRLLANFNLESPIARHSIRYGVALAVGVAAYRVAGMREHGYWIPLTILFVLRAERDETDRRLVLRAVGTLAGLVIATGLAFAFDGAEVPIAIVLSITAALSFGLITVQYALFTAAITIYVVLLSDTLGEDRFDAAGQRLIGTAAGIVIAYLAFRIYPGPGEKRSLR